MWLGIALAVAWAGEAKDRRDVEAAFARYVALIGTFDPALGELYAPDAKISAVRAGKRLELTGAQVRAQLPVVMQLARVRGEADTFSAMAVSRGDAGQWRVSATRTSAALCFTDPGHGLDFAKVEGRWLIVAERAEVASRSFCPPDPNLPSRLVAVQGQLAPRLPMTLDEETVLDGLRAEGAALTYEFLLPRVTSAELPRFEPALQTVVLQNVCGDIAVRDLVDDGATVSYRYRTPTGESLAFSVVNGDCP